MSVYSLLNKVQTELVAPKNQYNAFGKYSYRSCEDILEGVKPLLETHKCVIVISDSIEMIGERIYVKATAKFVECETGDTIECTAYAREELSKAGMSEGQLTGSTSSYSRKYALNALLLCDDSKDADTMDNSKKEEAPQQKQYEDDPNKEWLDDATQLIAFCKTHNLSPSDAVAQGRKKYKISKAKAKEIEEAMK
tara:strand:+ start:56 stop:640 length:585 start_codon:yes stop_codon:yes gene_type:complete